MPTWRRRCESYGLGSGFRHEVCCGFPADLHDVRVGWAYSVPWVGDAVAAGGGGEAGREGAGLEARSRVHSAVDEEGGYVKPHGALVFPSGMQVSLTYMALIEAARYLPRSAFYLLTVHPDRLRDAAELVRAQLKVVEENPLAPVLGLNADFSWTDLEEWTLSAGGAVFWSTGA